MDPKDFLSEAHIMKRLRHPKLIQVRPTFTKDWHRLWLLSFPVVCCLHIRGAHLHRHWTNEIWQPFGVPTGVNHYLFNGGYFNHFLRFTCTITLFFPGQGEAAKTSSANRHVSTGNFCLNTKNHIKYKSPSLWFKKDKFFNFMIRLPVEWPI